ncbi:hypothetical protein V8F33_008691 [Rhypophila sp. PSN 637]
MSVEFDHWYTIAPDPRNPYVSVVKCHYNWIGAYRCLLSGLDDKSETNPVLGYGEGQWFNLPSQDGAPLPYLNGSLTMSQTFRVSALAAQQGSESNINVQKLYRKKWDDMVLNVWPVVIVHLNATLDPLLTDDRERQRANRRDRPISLVQCIAPNGVGTGRAFTFSGEVPGTPPPPPPEQTGISETDGDLGEKSGCARRFELGSDKAYLFVWVLGLAFAAMSI